MREQPSRRDFLGLMGAVLVLNTLPSAAKSENIKHRFLSSSLSPEILKQHKEVAVDSLTESIPPGDETAYLRAYSQYLPLESQMYIPDTLELKEVVAKSMSELDELAMHMSEGARGIFVFADALNEEHMQRMYVVEKMNKSDLQFIKGYRISMARKGFGSENDSSRTPLGLHWIANETQGLFGEVVSGLNKNRDSFTHIVLDGKDHWFVKGFGAESENEVAEVVTDQYLLVGPHTDPSRGIRIHGTNRSGEIQNDGTWKSFLGGTKRSTGCIRMANTDVRDLSLSGYVQHQNTPLPHGEPSKTFVMIHATAKARDLSERNAIDFKKWFLGKK